MRILIGVAHPKHVYLFKNLINCLINRGHVLKIIAIEKEMTTYLLKKFNIPFEVIGTNQPTLTKKILELPKWEYNTFKIAKDFNPDIYVGRALPHFAHVSFVFRKPFVIFEDTEIAKLVHKITLPFATSVVTPYCYKDDIGKKHIRFNSFYELGYLDPKYFKPDISVLDDLGLGHEEKIIILRFVAWNASHDSGQKGMDDNVISEYISKLERYGRVFISSEKKVNEKFEKYVLNIAPEKLHSLLNYSSLCISEGGTIAVEAALLGTPSIYISPFVNMGNFIELKEKYNLLETFQDYDLALNKAISLLEDINSKNEMIKRKNILLNEKIDVNKVIISIIEQYS